MLRNVRASRVSVNTGKNVNVSIYNSNVKLSELTAVESFTVSLENAEIDAVTGSDSIYYE